MDSKEFLKFVRDRQLINNSLSETELFQVFAKVQDDEGAFHSSVGALGLDAGQLQAWQAFYDGVNGMSSCSKCRNRNDPCSCGYPNGYGPGVLCEGNSITKISLYSCSLSGKSRVETLVVVCIVIFLYGSHMVQFSFLLCNIVKNNFCQFLFSHVG